MYNHTKVIVNAIEPKYSMYFGAPSSADCSIISKSITRLKAAMATTNKEKPIAVLLLPLIIFGRPNPNNDKTHNDK